MNYALPESDATRTYVSAAVLEEEGNEIEITYPDSNRDSRNFANARQREKGRERSGRRGNYLCVRPPSIYAVSFESNSWFPRSMLARYVDGWIRAICTKHSRRIDNSHDRRDESAGITLRDEFASVNLARISQTRDTYTLTVIESSMRRITLSNYTHRNFLFRPPSTLS